MPEVITLARHEHRDTATYLTSAVGEAMKSRKDVGT